MKRTNIKHKPSDKCSTVGCDEPAKILDKCHACYNWLHRWSQCSLSHRHTYARRIARIAARQEELEGQPKLRLVRK